MEFEIFAHGQLAGGHQRLSDPPDWRPESNNGIPCTTLRLQQSFSWVRKLWGMTELDWVVDPKQPQPSFWEGVEFDLESMNQYSWDGPHPSPDELNHDVPKLLGLTGTAGSNSLDAKAGGQKRQRIRRQSEGPQAPLTDSDVEGTPQSLDKTLRIAQPGGVLGLLGSSDGTAYRTRCPGIHTARESHINQALTRKNVELEQEIRQLR